MLALSALLVLLAEEQPHKPLDINTQDKQLACNLLEAGHSLPPYHIVADDTSKLAVAAGDFEALSSEVLSGSAAFEAVELGFGFGVIGLEDIELVGFGAVVVLVAVKAVAVAVVGAIAVTIVVVVESVVVGTEAAVAGDVVTVDIEVELDFDADFDEDFVVRQYLILDFRYLIH